MVMYVNSTGGSSLYVDLEPTLHPKPMTEESLNLLDVSLGTFLISFLDLRILSGCD